MTLPVAETELPPIWCPLESAVHPRVKEVHKRAEEWIRASGMCPTERECAWAAASHSADFYARFVPEADEERLLATALWVYWGFAFDDARCDSGPLSSRPGQFAILAGRVQRALEAPSVRDTSEPFIPPLQDIVARFRSLGTPAQVRRFADAHRAWLSGVAWQIGNQAAGRMPDLDEYLAMRVLASGGEPTFAMVELANGPEVPSGELHHPAVRALTEMAITVAALDNDRHSMRKELLRDNADQNIFSVLMHHQDLSRQEAVEASIALRDRVLARFLVVHDRVRPKAGEALARYLQGLRHGIRGNAEWGVRVPRYLSMGASPDTMADSELEWADAPSDGSATPVDAPAVSWWWDDALV